MAASRLPEGAPYSESVEESGTMPYLELLSSVTAASFESAQEIACPFDTVLPRISARILLLSPKGGSCSPWISYFFGAELGLGRVGI